MHLNKKETRNMKKIIFAFFITVFTQNAISVEDSEYFCGKNKKEWTDGLSSCQRGDILLLYGNAKIEMGVLGLCEWDTLRIIRRQVGVCVYRGSSRNPRELLGIR